MLLQGVAWTKFRKEIVSRVSTFTLEDSLDPDNRVIIDEKGVVRVTDFLNAVWHTMVTDYIANIPSYEDYIKIMATVFFLSDVVSIILLCFHPQGRLARATPMDTMQKNFSWITPGENDSCRAVKIARNR